MLRIASAKSIFIISLIYTSIVSIFVQFILLPIFLPDIHSGGGLLLGFDMNTFHREASEIASSIDEGGWSNFKISGSISGLAAFFYYITGIHEIYVVIPFNALVHSLSAVLIYCLIKLILNDKMSAFFGAIVFIFLPSSIFWYAQLHKDGVFILGVFLFIFGFIGIIKYAFNGKIIQTLVLLMFPIFGNMLSVLMRPYYAPVVEVMAFLLSLIFTIYIFYKIDEYRKKLLLILGFVFITISILITNNFISSEHTAFNIVNSIKLISEPLPSQTQLESEPLPSSVEIARNEFRIKWLKTILQIPEGFTNSLVKRRDKYIRKHGMTGFSNIDINQKLDSLSDIILYTPRALQIGLAAPFPNQWFAPARSSATYIFKVINVFEMILYYLSFIGIILIYIKNKEPVVYASVMGYALINLIAFTVAIPNIGTLHRIRYGFTMLIVCLGCAQIFKLLHKNKRDVR